MSRDLEAMVEVGALLGRGGTAEVFAAVDRETGAPRALKRLVPRLAARTTFRYRFGSEVDLLVRCAGPHVLAAHGSGDFLGTPAYVCERCVCSLEDEGRRGPIPLPRLLRLGAEALVALDRVHAAGAVHRDIKPGNLLIADDGSARLADFGVARHPSRRMTVVGALVGTPPFAAPEAMADPRGAAPADDLYSLGLMVFALATGRPPTELADARRRAQWLARLPPAFSHLVQRSTAPNPRHRYGSAAEMAVAVQQAMPEAVAAAVAVPDPGDADPADGDRSDPALDAVPITLAG